MFELANLNEHYFNNVMDKHIPEIVNEGTWIKRRTNPRPNVLMLGVHQKMPH